MSPQTKRLNNLQIRLRQHRDVRDVEYVEGDEVDRYYVTFDYHGIPYRFGDLYNVELVGAWIVRERYRLREYITKPLRVRAVFEYRGEQA